MPRIKCYISVIGTQELISNNNNTRNFFKQKREDSRTKWQSILDEDNSKIFEQEMTETLTLVNRFVTKMEIESSILDQMKELSKESEKKFKDYLAMGRELLTKLKLLATLEKSSIMEKFEQSRVRKMSYAATEDTVSCVDTESVVDGYAALNKEESFDRRDSRAITLVHKYAASFTKHYKTMDRLNHDVEEIMDRFNGILDFIHQQLQQRATIPVRGEYTRENTTDLQEIIRSTHEEQQAEENIQPITSTETASAVDILAEHLKKSSLTAIYKHVNASGSGHLVEHTFSCSVAGFNSEGKSRKKNRAKEDAAVQMIKEIMRRQKCDNLPNQIVPFTEMQMHELSIILSEREDLIDKLEDKCLHSHEPPPLYTVLSETGKNNEPYFTVKCEAMGYTAVGHGSTKIQAKKNSAKSILNLETISRKSRFSWQRDK